MQVLPSTPWLTKPVYRKTKTRTQPSKIPPGVVDTLTLNGRLPTQAAVAQLG
jgi:hypothetical protein